MSLGGCKINVAAAYITFEKENLSTKSGYFNVLTWNKNLSSLFGVDPAQLIWTPLVVLTRVD